MKWGWLLPVAERVVEALRGRRDRKERERIRLDQCAWCRKPVTAFSALCPSCLDLHRRQLAEQDAQRTGDDTV